MPKSFAGGIKVHFHSRKDDLAKPVVFGKFWSDFQGGQYPTILVWGLRHFVRSGRYDVYPQLKVPGDNPTWDLRYFSTGDWSRQGHTETLFEVVFPYWFLFLALLAPALGMSALSFRPFRRRTMNRCSRCGYDLRATPDRCPECGAIPKAEAIRRQP